MTPFGFRVPATVVLDWATFVAVPVVAEGGAGAPEAAAADPPDEMMSAIDAQATPIAAVTTRNLVKVSPFGR